MTHLSHNEKRSAFTLIELMVVVAIIGLLVGILLPTFKGVTTRAKAVATQARFAALDQGLESFRGERSLGGLLPPSQTDWPNFPGRMIDPLSNEGQVLAIAGANLLVYGLVGADRLGTPGFPDLGDSAGWYDDQHANTGGAYELDPQTREPIVPRFPSSGGSYVDDATKASIRNLIQLNDEGVALTPIDALLRGVSVQPFFTDAWGRPILYYRANRAGRYMVTEPGENIGVYDQRDNAVLTGSTVPPFDGLPPIDFGPGLRSEIGASGFPDVNPNNANILDPSFDGTFERFIYDSSVTARNRPINPEKYLLISAGADAIYGTSDDVVNWERR